jgi:hypothetical protein
MNKIGRFVFFLNYGQRTVKNKPPIEMDTASTPTLVDYSGAAGLFAFVQHPELTNVIREQMYQHEYIQWVIQKTTVERNVPTLAVILFSTKYQDSLQTVLSADDQNKFLLLRTEFVAQFPQFAYIFATTMDTAVDSKSGQHCALL